MTEKRTILVADDDKSVRELLRKALEEEGYHVSTAVDGLDALKQVDASPPDLLIADISMPELDGLKLVAGLRSHPDTKGLPIIFLTGSESPRDFAASVHLQARFFFTKPVATDHLVKVVRQLFRSM